MDKRVLFLAVALLPEPILAGDSVIPNYAAADSADAYWSTHARNGYLTREQTMQYGVRDFARIDGDNDGRVSQPEWNAWHGARSQPAFSDAEWKQFDRNRDGVIHKREAVSMDARTWTHADLNADGKISKKEWQAIAAKTRAPSLTAWQRADRDNDGFVTRAEGAAMETAAFTRIDSDGDGRLSQKEWDLADSQASGVAGRPAPLPGNR
jgi:Ca2+-binding EF-hand superfamily protein